MIQEKMVCGQQDGVLIMYMLLELFSLDCLELVIHLINNGLVILQINLLGVQQADGGFG
jgi:hypothetical protein